MTHTRTELNKAIDQCPTIVQEHIWGHGGLREQVEALQQRLERAEATLLRAKQHMTRRGVGVAIINEYFKGESDE